MDDDLALAEISASQHAQQIATGWREEQPHIAFLRAFPTGLTPFDVSEFDQRRHRFGVGREPEATWRQADRA